MYSNKLSESLRLNKENLEKRIEERTNELSLSNKRLKHEIQRRIKAEEAIRKREALLNETGKMAHVGGWELDVNSLKQVWTEELYRMYEVDLNYEPTLENGLAFFSQESRPVIEQAARRAIDYGEPFNVELTVITAKGNLRWVYIIGKAHQKNGKTVKLSGTMQNITEYKRVLEKLESSREQLRNLSSYLQSSIENERKRAAREIHDDLGQSLMALKMDISWIKSRLPNDNIPLLNKHKSMDETITHTIKSVKRIVANLRPGPLEDLGLIAAVEWQIADFQNRTGIKYRFHNDLEKIILDTDRAVAIYRILQESLTNIIRHASASEVDITLLIQDGKVILKIADNGVGIPEDKITNSKSIGLIGMHERAGFFGGEIKIKGIPGKGTIVDVIIPCV
ncbi:MAG: histidine kinase [Syntrophales bacterium]